MINQIKPNQRIGVFYDGNFLLHVSNYYYHIHWQHKRLDIGGLHRFIASRLAQEQNTPDTKLHISQAHYFRGRLNAAEAQARNNQLYNDRVFDDVLMSEGIETHYLPLRNMFGKREERGTDVWLSLEVYERALMGQIDTAVLVISDTDYLPLVRKLMSLGIQVMILGWEFEFQNDMGQKCVTKTSHELLDIATHPILMHQVIEDGLINGDDIVHDLFIGGAAEYDLEVVDKWNKMPKQRIINQLESEAIEREFEEDDDMEREPNNDNNMDETTSNEPRYRSHILSLKAGYGFIKYPDNNLFFHSGDLINADFTFLAPGTIVTFNIGKNDAGDDVAKNVMVESNM